jgi:hypothetical protein
MCAAIDLCKRVLAHRSALHSGEEAPPAAAAAAAAAGGGGGPPSFGDATLTGTLLQTSSGHLRALLAQVRDWD